MFHMTVMKLHVSWIFFLPLFLLRCLSLSLDNFTAVAAAGFVVFLSFRLLSSFHFLHGSVLLLCDHI